MNNNSKICPRTDARVTFVADEANLLTRFDVQRRLGELQAEAENVGDGALASAARVEGNVLAMFENERSLSRSFANLRQYIFDTDVEYLRERAQATLNLRAQARYLHAIALLTSRHDDANSAVDALIDALRQARLVRGDPSQTAEAFNQLRDLYPLLFRLARRARAQRRVLEEAIEFITSDNEGYVHAKTRVFRTVLAEVTLKQSEARRLRDASLAILFAARGGDHGEIVATAEAGRRLADKLGEPHTPWLQAEARALEAKLEYNNHPMLVQMIGVRLLRIYQLLADEERVLATIEHNRIAAANMEYQTHTFTLDDEGASEQRYREYARDVYQQHGPGGALSSVALGQAFPRVNDIRVNIERMEAQGIGSFRQIAQVIVSADERIIAENPQGRAFDEQYDIAWTLTARVHGIMMEEWLAAGLTLDDVESMLRGSWLGRDEDGCEPNDLVDLLMPCFRLYFAVLDDDHWMRVPALDSLVMRFEALVRKLARLVGVPHVRATGGENRVLVEHAGLRLLEHKRIATVVGEDLIEYAKHTLMRDPEGLRDRVGHALLHRGGYRLDDLHAMFILYLRFAALAVGDEDVTPNSASTGVEETGAA
jgi:hypothetical protein